MASPFPPSTSHPGHGTLTAHLLPHALSALSTLTFQYPLKLISPTPHPTSLSVLVFLLTYGGGLVGGDAVHLSISVGAGAKLSIVTQGHTKIFKSPSRDVVTRQTLVVRVYHGAGIVVLPDPVQPFGESVYEQSQVWRVEEGGSACVLDWVCSGRIARGEDWAFWGWKGRNEVWTMGRKGQEEKGRLLVRDNVILEGDSPEESLALKQKMHGLRLFGTLILKGPMVEKLAAFFMAEFAALPRIGGRDFRSRERVVEDEKIVVEPREKWRRIRLRQEADDGILWSAAKVRSCIVVKFGAKTVEGGRVWVGSMLKEEGSIAQTFGEDALMCVR